MLASNELNYKYMVKTTEMLLDLVCKINRELSVSVEFINIGGGLGIPYKPEDEALDIVSLGKEVSQILSEFSYRNGYSPKLFIESGRYMTGPHGILVTKAINFKNIYRRYVGVDACMSSLMRPAIYGAYHHITVPGKKTDKIDTVDVVGSLCENNDKFAVQRNLPELEEGDLICIHDTGAHGYAMGFNYNARLRPKELLLKSNGVVELIRRQETMDDYLSTLNFQEKILN
jgi:diaminopimelate decarboxylase